MPPPNSASRGTPISPSTPAAEPAPRRSSFPNSPVPVENDNAHDENVNFLRSRSLLHNPLLPSLSRHRRRRYHTAPRPMDGEDRMDLDDPSNSRLSVEINRRIPIVRRQREDSANMPNYESQRTNTRSLYGWAPGSDDDDDAVHRDESEDDQIQPFLHAISNPSAPSNRRRIRDMPPTRSVPLPIPAPATATTEEAERESAGTLDSRMFPMEMFLQTARLPTPQPRPSRTRTLENYLLDRYSNERHSNQSNEELEETEPPGGSSSSRAYRYRPPNRGHAQRILTHSDLRARTAAHRQLHSSAPGESLLKDTISYLDRLRYSSSFAESLNSAAATGFISMENLSWKDSDFLLDTNTIAPPAACSWLRPGVVFSGCQRATNAGCSVLSQRVPSPHAPGDPVIVNGSDSTRVVYRTNGRQYLPNSRDENWPVKVTVHNINYNEMTLSGTMEAYNIPDKTSPNQDAHIVTFLEGEIIDFNKHTLETKNFKADADIDSTYWRELHPFKDLTDSEISKKLVSRKWIAEELAKGWILMRWKERCFITPTDPRQGLTISGFYYISLRREDGHVEGLYYDPGSSPYQQLSLKPETVKMSRPSLSFR